MQVVIELDGPILDIRPRYTQAHRLVQAELGLASREAGEFWRLVRKGAGLDEIVRPFRPGQSRAYARRFEEVVASDALLDLDVPQPGVGAHLAALRAVASCGLVAHRANREATQRLLDRYELWRWFRTLRLLSRDRSVRVSQLAELVGLEAQTVMAIASEPLVRSARETGAVTVGIASGACTPRRLRQAGAELVVADVGELLEAIRTSSTELLRAGYRPPDSINGVQ
jgi:phosphoglycolate phosphatase-like HAD superfamily hydrolase